MQRLVTHALTVTGFVVALAGAPGCATPGPGRAAGAPPLLDTLRRQIDAHDGIVWSAVRRLAWTDFQGVAPAGKGEASAETGYSLFHGARCTGRRFEFQVVAVFLPRQSWVKPAVLASPAESSRTLRHEQTHFDLSEVHARRMRRYFSQLFEPCMKTAEELSALADRFIREEAAAQAKYDSETNNGRTARRQTDWEAEVGRQLAALGKFER